MVTLSLAGGFFFFPAERLAGVQVSDTRQRSPAFTPSMMSKAQAEPRPTLGVC
jgi:hypothetical protein